MMIRHRPRALVAIAGFAALVVVASAGEARAQTGLGARFSWIRASGQPDGLDSTRFFGGFFRARMSPRSAFELSLDYHSVTSPAGTGSMRVVEYPLQTSLLLYPVRSTFGVYVLGGLGWYWQKVQVFDIAGVGGGTSRRFGYHAGLGGELEMGRHVAIHLDYRYTMIGTGDEPQGCSSCSGAVPIPGLGGLQDRLNLSHKGSMWTSGVAFYF